ncbi:hypothetical protein MMC11_008758 [Xylographa trunciseda]|nr:hypothetical protein [Xylographa trunciseda]
MASVAYCRTQLRERLTSTKKSPRQRFDQPVVEDDNQDVPLDPGTITTPIIALDGAAIRPPAAKKSLAFFAIIMAISFTGLLTALDATITSTALPTIINQLGGADLYIWVVNVYFLTMTAFQPLYGQLANLFGRRYPVIGATAAFVLGSGICGGATNISMLIAGRAIQGIGAGGINVLIEIIICDLLPLRERGNYLALIFGLIAVGTAAGPIFGGLIVEYSSWRWVFYLNLPVGGAALFLLVVFLQVNFKPHSTIASRVTSIDWVGNIIFVLSMVSILIALSWAGTEFPWSSFHIIVPLILGLLGCIVFFIYENSKYCVSPVMPLYLFRHRTSTVSFILTFLHSVVTIWTIYFLPVYFQGVLASSTGRSGVQLLPTILVLVPFAAAAGGLVAKFGRYRPVHHVGFAIMVIGFGLFSLLDADSSTGAWVMFQAIEAAGVGLIIPTLLPAVQAELTDADTALATSTWAFVRSFGMIWGATIPAAIFNNRVAQLSGQVSDANVVASLVSGQAYEHATQAFLESLPNDTVRSQVTSVFADALKYMWYIAIAFTGLGFLIVIIEREVPLRKELDTEFGIAQKETKQGVPIGDTDIPLTLRKQI